MGKKKRNLRIHREGRHIIVGLTFLIFAISTYLPLCGIQLDIRNHIVAFSSSISICYLFFPQSRARIRGR